jgi:succinyl-CoA synthetase beta subunit
MDLYEFQARTCLRTAGVKVADSVIIRDANEVVIWKNFPAVVKAQVKTGGRGKAGGVKIAHNQAELDVAVQQILEMSISGHTVRSVLVTQAAKIESEYYLSITFDRSTQNYLLMFSTSGGVEIEQLARDTPDKIVKFHFSPLAGLSADLAEQFAKLSGVSANLQAQLADVALQLWRCYEDNDATLVEINPLAVVDGNLEALDAKVTLDDNAQFRHVELFDLFADNAVSNPLEVKAQAHNLAYIKLDGGSVGIVGNGAGLVMSTLDLVTASGAETGVKPANFLDIGGGASAEKMAQALSLVLEDKDVKTVLINIFGGLTQCSLVATGILEAVGSFAAADLKPIFVRFAGNEADEGVAILQKAGLDFVKVYLSQKQAVDEAVANV